MFTLEQIDDIHDNLGDAETLALYVHALNAIGVERYDSFVSDGHSEYFGKDGYTVTSPAYHEMFAIADTSDEAAFLKHLRLHEQGETSYVEMSRGLAESGIEKWTVDTNRLTMAFCDKDGNQLLVEAIT
jgi:uncharacterized protein YbcV (DUF1398 family)